MSLQTSSLQYDEHHTLMIDLWFISRRPSNVGGRSTRLADLLSLPTRAPVADKTTRSIANEEVPPLPNIWYSVLELSVVE